jgi:hypothetical protein
MIIYSVTVKIDLDIHNDWLHWMKNFHIPEVLNTKKFQDYRMLRVLAEDETDGITYNIQYRALSMSDYFDYQSNHAVALQNDHTERYKDKFVAFRTILKEVE